MAQYKRIEEFDYKMDVVCPYCKAKSNMNLKIGVEILKKDYQEIELLLVTEKLICPYCKENFSFDKKIIIKPLTIENEEIKLKIENL